MSCSSLEVDMNKNISSKKSVLTRKFLFQLNCPLLLGYNFSKTSGKIRCYFLAFFPVSLHFLMCSLLSFLAKESATGGVF